MYEELKEDFTKVVKYSQNYRETVSLKGIDSLWEKWEQNKQLFINAFGGLIYELPNKIHWELTDEQKRSNYIDFIHWMRDRYSDLVRELKDFLSVHISYEEFYQNALSKNIILNRRDEEITLQAGMKLLKTFKHFIKNKRILEDIQSKASQIIQENKIEGTLCFSVHPLDYLSISESTYNWRSCHALDGEYRAGNLSYMIDRSTFICYLKSDKDEILPNFPSDVPWNSKKWRVLLFLSKNRDVLTAGRQYPFGNKQYLEMIFPALSNTGLFAHNYYDPSITDAWDTNWGTRRLLSYTAEGSSESKYPDYPYIDLMGYLIRTNNLFKTNKNSLNYNDLLHSSCYTPLSICNKRVSVPAKMDIGGEVKCLHCGENILECTDQMICRNCCDIVDDCYRSRCACCERTLEENEIITVNNGEIICPSCAERYTTFCSVCGELYFNEHIDWKDGEPYCGNCFAEKFPEEVASMQQSPESLWVSPDPEAVTTPSPIATMNLDEAIASLAEAFSLDSPFEQYMYQIQSE